jgi:hypothetical protein
MSQVIYARVPDNLKEAADVYASDRGITLTSAVVDLLAQGLAAASDELSITELSTRLAQTTAEKAEAEAKLSGAVNELGALRAFAERASQHVGTCPSCAQTITGYELLALGRCNHCGQTLMNLVAPSSPASHLDQREIGLLLGALGVALVGAAIIGSMGA